MNAEDRSFSLRPTAWSIQRGSVVLNKRFVEAHSAEINWQAFKVVCFGKILTEDKQLDRQRRLALSLRAHLKDGDVLRFAVDERRLVVEKVGPNLPLQ